MQPASASSIIKIWIVLAVSVHRHLPLSRHTSPLPPNAFSLPKHIPTPDSSCKSLQSIRTPQQPNKPLPHCCAQRAGVSDSKYDVSSAVRPCTSLSPAQTQTQTLSWLVLPNQDLTSDSLFPSLWDSFLRHVLCYLGDSTFTFLDYCVKVLKVPNIRH